MYISDRPLGTRTPLLSATILAGGSGTRFWPLSTSDRPKQFITLFGNRTMLQHTFDRLHGLVPPERVLVLTNERFIPTVREQLPELPAQNVIGEPLPRDTSAAVTLGAVIAQARWGDHVMLVLPADHAIEPTEAFQEAMRSAARGAWESGALYTFGIPPTHPETGYGYLETGERLEGGTDDAPHFRLVRFKEKPDLQTAREYLARGGFYWNSGMFAWRCASILSEVARHLPRHAERLLPLGNYDGSEESRARLTAALEPLPRVSIDFGVMEKAAEVRMVRAPFQWSDVGGWAALAAYLEKDEAGNYVQGTVHGLAAKDNLVYCDSEDETVALVGVEGLVVVRAGRRTLVVHRDRLEDVKRLVESMPTGS